MEAAENATTSSFALRTETPAHSKTEPIKRGNTIPEMQPNTHPDMANQSTTQQNQNGAISGFVDHVKWGTGKLVWKRTKQECKKQIITRKI